MIQKIDYINKHLNNLIGTTIFNDYLLMSAELQNDKECLYDESLCLETVNLQLKFKYNNEIIDCKAYYYANNIENNIIFLVNGNKFQYAYGNNLLRYGNYSIVPNISLVSYPIECINYYKELKQSNDCFELFTI